MKLECDFTDNMQKYINRLEKLGDTTTMKGLGEIVYEGVVPYIPTKTGTMAKSCTKTVTKNQVIVDWTNGTPYTRYQFYGKVMGPNKAVWAQGANKNGVAGVHIGWVSPIAPKHLTTRNLGEAHDITLHDGRVIHIRGYTNPKSRPMWTVEARQDPEIWYPIRFKMGRYLYEAWRNSNNGN